jgi:IS4 transposase
MDKGRERRRLLPSREISCRRIRFLFFLLTWILKITKLRRSFSRTHQAATLNDGLPASMIAALYKQRWHVELFFKWIK